MAVKETTEKLLELADNLARLVRCKLPYPSVEDTIAMSCAANDYVEARQARKQLRPGMPQGFTFKIVTCPDCGQWVADNWIIRHRKSGCQKGIRAHKSD